MYIKQNRLQIVIRNKKGHYIVIKEWLQEKDIEIFNIYIPNKATHKYINIKKHKEKTNSNTNNNVRGF